MKNEGKIVRTGDRSRSIDSLMGSAIALACGMSPMAALAQTAPGPADFRAGHASNAQAGDRSELTDIVVTAQKRSESLLKVPAAITALSGDALRSKGVTDVRSLESLVPGVTIRPEGAVSQVFIRGVGSNIDVPYAESGVGYTLNGVTLPRYASTSALFDVSSVEILPGPQGTLYGGGSAGGVINIRVQQPEDNMHGSALLEGGNYAQIHASVGQNLPVSNDLLARVAVDYQRHDAYQSNGGDTMRRIAGRLTLAYRPSDAVLISLWVNGDHNEGKPNDTINIPYPFPGHPWRLPAVNPILPFIDLDASHTYQKFTSIATGGQVSWDIGDVTVRDTAGYVYVNTDHLRFAGYAPERITDRENQYSNELTISNNAVNRLKWLAGAFYYHDMLDFTLDFLNTPALRINGQRNQSIAGFGQLTYSLADALRLTVGGRYSRDSKKASGGAIGGAAGFENFAADLKWNRFDWKAGFEADLGSRTLLYGIVQTGYVPGGYSPHPDTTTFDNEIKPATLLSFTAGIKTQLFSNRLQFSTEAYYYKYRNYIVQTIDLANNGLTTVYNAPRARIYGNQVNLRWLASDTTTFHIGANFMSAKFTRFSLGVQDFSGFQLTDAPSAVLDGGIEQSFTVGNGGGIVFDANTHYENGHWGQFNHIAGTHQGAYTKTDLTLTYNSPDHKWALAAWAKNLENADVFGATAASPFPGPAAAFIDPPRTYGVRLSRKW